MATAQCINGGDAVADPSRRFLLLVADRGQDPEDVGARDLRAETDRCPNRGNTNRSRLAGQACACFGLRQPERF